MDNNARDDGAGSAGSALFSPVAILDAARKAVPAVDYALGAAGIAAAGSIVVALLGNGRAAIIIVGGLFIAMVLLFAFARLVTAQNAAAQSAGVSLLWMVIVFFGTFLAFTITAVAFHWPQAWAQILGIVTDDGFDKKAMEKLLEVPREISNRLGALNSRGPIELIRLQPHLSDPMIYAKREAALNGGGSYYSFVRRTHEYGGSDIELWPGQFLTGFEGTDYGFFMYTGQGALEELMTLKRDAPPSHLETLRIDAWKYLWDYRPPREIKSIRAEQRKSRGFDIAGVTLAKQVTVNRGGMYLLRSILIERSDLLIGLYVADTLTDGSVVLAWTTVNIFDTPIATGQDD
jgi:hypothetical protein